MGFVSKDDPTCELFPIAYLEQLGKRAFTV